MSDDGSADFLQAIADRQNRENARVDALATLRKRRARRSARSLAVEMGRVDPGVLRVFLFGSALKGKNFRIDSDIDLAVEGGEFLKLFILVEKSKIPVDLVDFKFLNPDMKVAILRDGEILYEKIPR